MARRRRRQLRIASSSSSSSSEEERGRQEEEEEEEEEEDDVQVLSAPPPSNVSRPHNSEGEVNLHSNADVERELHSRGVRPKSQWLSACLQSLAASNPSFHHLPITQQAQLCFAHYLFTDLNFHGDALLPPQLHSLHSTQLAGPFVLQVDEITDIGSPIRGRYKEKAASAGGRCLKLSITDGVQRIFGFEYRPIKDLKVFLPAGIKIAVRHVYVRRGLLMLVPEVLIVLGGYVEHLEAARQRVVQEINKPPCGRRSIEGTIEQSLIERATVSAWHSDHSNDNTPTTDGLLSTSGLPNASDHGREVPSLQSLSRSRSLNSNFSRSAHPSNNNISPTGPQHVVNSPFTYLAILKEKWDSRHSDNATIQAKIKCILTGVKEFQFKNQDHFKLVVYIDDGSLIRDVLIAHQVVEKFLGHTPRQVTYALSSTNSQECQSMKDTLKTFQAFLVKFEGFMTIKNDPNSPIPVILEMTEGCTNSNAWMLLYRLQNIVPEMVSTDLTGIDISP